MKESRWINYLFIAVNNTTAYAEIPSSLPTNPIFSAVVAFIETCVSSTPRMEAITCCIRDE
jgi:hypothetical protein